MLIRLDNGVEIVIEGDECRIALPSGKLIKIDKNGEFEGLKRITDYIYTDRKNIPSIRDAVEEMRL